MDSEYMMDQLKNVIIKELPAWRDLKKGQILFIKQTGFTNIIYKASVLVDGVTPKNIIFRKFNDNKDIIDYSLEHSIFCQMGELDLGPKCLAKGDGYRIEEYIEDGVHPTIPMLRSKEYRLLVA